MSSVVISPADEQRLRELAQGVAKDMEEIPDLVRRLGFTMEDYAELCTTKVFRGMLDEALNEWQGANNTYKRTKLKAAINVELALPSFYTAMTNAAEPLSARVKVLEVVSRIGGLGNPEPVAAGIGSAFNLTIHLDESVGARARDIVITGEAVREGGYSQSNLLSSLPFEEL
jgi:hypothetical protein